MSAASPASTPLGELPRGADIRLVAADMDGTLLTGDGAVPEGFWPLLERMRARGIVFTPASGRQCATLARLFERALDGMPLIAENGSYVVRDGAEISSATIERDVVTQIVHAVRAAVAGGRDLGVVLCGKKSAYIERHDEAFLAEGVRYYVKLAQVADVLTATDEFIKVAVFDFEQAADSVACFKPFTASHDVVVSGPHWIDIMVSGVNKGVALRELQRRLDVTPAQTVAFGDFFNDAEMLQAAGLSFAMANGHPRMREFAAYVAPSNTEGGVVTVLDRLLGG